MILLNVQVQEVARGEVLAALETAMRVFLCVVDFVLVKGWKGEGVRVGREGAFHLWDVKGGFF